LVQQLLNLSVVQDYKCCTKLDSNRNNVYLDRYTTDISGGGTITGQLAACGSTIAQTLTNSGTTAGVVRYTVTPTANNCAGSIFTVDITVRPKPVVTVANVTAQCSVTLIPPTATDNCGFTVTGTTGDPLSYNGSRVTILR
jgi:Flp pilus assembly protein TadG